MCYSIVRASHNSNLDTLLTVQQIKDIKSPTQLISILQRMKRNQRTEKLPVADVKAKYESITEGFRTCDWSFLQAGTF